MGHEIYTKYVWASALCLKVVKQSLPCKRMSRQSKWMMVHRMWTGNSMSRTHSGDFLKCWGPQYRGQLAGAWELWRLKTACFVFVMSFLRPLDRFKTVTTWSMTDGHTPRKSFSPTRVQLIINIRSTQASTQYLRTRRVSAIQIITLYLSRPGTLINRFWVMTAAHCFRDFEEDRLPFVKLVFGAHKFNGEFVEGTEQVKWHTKQLILHYRFEANQIFSRHKGEPRAFHNSYNGFIGAVVTSIVSITFGARMCVFGSSHEHWTMAVMCS